ncbi:hypothetical protein OJF2_71660 [Aquisphaera giovannonii]|uniref:Multicopper oxidase n=1 Tax=Aquisphaera giovannonii TaxID=406548 RepID=A0A5B9WDN4_9BACT|nr:hypothetical protein [Aquisphaera giovannonii]QEH38563.1 hypothetical protein OJF2_71660 [Aquisphaera giovannonii]
MRRPGGLSSFLAIVPAALLLLGAGSRAARSDTIEVDGVIAGGMVKWVVGGSDATNVAVKPGDEVVWKAVSGTHGALFDAQATAESLLAFQSGGGLPALGPQTAVADGAMGWGTPPLPAGSTLARATVKAGVPAGATLGFFCTQHGRMMSGSLKVPTATNVIQIDGVIQGGTPTWMVGTKAAADVEVKSGDTIAWRAVSGTHGVVFDTQAQAEAFLSFEGGGGLPALGPQTVGTETVWGTAPQAAGTILAQATVKPGLPPGTTLGFFCSRHGRHMGGMLARPPLKLAPNDSPKDPSGLDDPRIKRVVKAQVVALDYGFLCNRLGTAMPQGMIFALKRDVVPNSSDPKASIGAGCVTLRPGKRARPVVLRANVGDCLEITFTNLLSESPPKVPFPLEHPATRTAGVHVSGMELIGTVDSDASYVGLNLDGQAAANSSDCKPGETKIYRFYARAEGAFLLYSTAAQLGASLDAAQLTAGLFGSVTVEPEGAEWYRSQVTRKDLELASKPNRRGPHGHPVIDYDATYPAGTSYEDLSPDGGGLKTPIPAGTPILRMTKPAPDDHGKPALEIVHSDLTAIVTGPYQGLLPEPAGRPNPVYPDARKPYREFSIHYHDALTAVQAFPEFNPPGPGQPETRTSSAMSAGQDNFAINYGMAGIGAEIWANRIKVGPMARSVESKYEEFFLSSWVVGDPAMIVDHPANSQYQRDFQPQIAAVTGGHAAGHAAAADAPAGDAGGGHGPSEPLPPAAEAAPPATGAARPLMSSRSSPPVPRGFPRRRPPEEDVGLEAVETPAAATKAYFPDDPSNVYHSYLNDHVRFRVLHAGGNITHVHHLHAHQWLRTPGSDESLLLDSQTITPGDGFTQEIIYGSGNRNLTVGDSIFHCHFYPHFAQGMWSLWRTHDVFEAGTPLDPDGRAAADSRALPDGEIERGTPIPAVVPIPTLPMAPIPAPVKIVKVGDPSRPNELSGYKAVPVDPGSQDNPGYPFFVPGVGGRRSPHPPLDFAVDGGVTLDGGLPRHIIMGGDVSYQKQNAYDFTKLNEHLSAVELPEQGTPEEQVAMAFHELKSHPTDTPDGGTGLFLTNGKPRAPGAPYADPTGGPYTKPEELGGHVVYKAADIQLDVVLNKSGWHYPQQRILSLWGDVRDTLENRRIAEPLFFRANSGDVVEYWQANLVPNVYELDDFQVRTPTDVIGQHIHLVKFDVTSSDGGANGFNYEDGTFSPDEVRERIEAINKAGGIFLPGLSGRKTLKAKPIPFFGPGAPIVDVNGNHVNAWDGAQATVQRWFADPITDNPQPPKSPKDRTLRSVFTHDHLGPSTHQQAGLYAALLVEPRGSSWSDSSTGLALGGRDAAPYDSGTGSPTKDGGPTSWQAIIASADKASSYREFALELQDTQLAYKSGSVSPPSAPVAYQKYQAEIPSPFPPTFGWTDPSNAINPPKLRDNNKVNQPTLITSGPEPGTRSINYRSEPISARIAPPNLNPMDPSHAFASIARNDPLLNNQGDPQNPIGPGSSFKYPNAYPGAGPLDPYTPLLRAYENDDVQVRVLIGAHFLPHSFNLHGLRWLQEAGNPDSGYVSTQVMSISEHYEMLFRLPPSAAKQLVPTTPPAADYLYMASSDTRGLLNGNWGILRAYQGKADSLAPLPTNPGMAAPSGALANVQKFYDGLVAAGKVKDFEVFAVSPASVKNADGTANPDGLVYYNRGSSKLNDPSAVVYVTKDDYDDANNQFKPGYIPEPLVLRANAGDLIRVKLTNRIALPGANGGRQRAGLHPQLLSYDVTTSDGFNGGNNANQTAEAPGDSVSYTWYAGEIDAAGNGRPVEFGAVNLTPSDPASSPSESQANHGLFGALVIEPEGATWVADTDSRAQATVTLGGDKGQFREFVLMIQDNVPASSAMILQAINYRTEPIAYRFNYQTDQAFPDFNAIDITDATSDLPSVVVPDPKMPNFSDPQTPIFHAPQKLPVRFRVLHPGGNSYTPFTIHGHVWNWTPTKKGTESRVLGNDSPSLRIGTLGSVPPNSQFNILLDHAGGEAGIVGDYLYRGFESTELQAGLWGIFRVGKEGADQINVRSVLLQGNLITVSGRVWKKLNAPGFAKEVSLLDAGGQAVGNPATVNPADGTFQLTAVVSQPIGAYQLSSSDGGTARLVVQPVQVKKVKPQLPAEARDRRPEDATRFLPQEMPLKP